MTKARDLANAGTPLSVVSPTELGYLDGVTSAVQTQLDSKTVVLKGTTAARPTGAEGDLYYDTSAENLYQKTASSGWKIAGQSGAPAPSTADVLMVAGGGGGVGAGGGAGGGGIVYAPAISVSGTYTISVGAGGSGSNGTGGNPTNGANSTFTGLTSAVGGGCSGGYTGAIYSNAGNGGSGGGASYYTGTTAGTGTAGQGNNGATGYQGTGGGDPRSGGGGGGAGAVGGSGSASQGGNGGVGTSTYSAWGAATVSGENVGGTYYFAGGGGGAANGSPGVGGYGGGTAGIGTAGGTVSNPPANTGGGPGSSHQTYVGNNGGSGVVFLRYADYYADLTSIAAGLTYTKYVTGGYKWYKFTAGTGTVTI